MEVDIYIVNSVYIALQKYLKQTRIVQPLSNEFQGDIVMLYQSFSYILSILKFQNMSKFIFVQISIILNIDNLLNN